MSAKRSGRSVHLSDLMALVFAYCGEQERQLWAEAIKVAVDATADRPITVEFENKLFVVVGDQVAEANEYRNAGLLGLEQRASQLPKRVARRILARVEEYRKAIEAIRAGGVTVDKSTLKDPNYSALRRAAEAAFRRSRPKPTLWECLRSNIVKRLSIDATNEQLDGLAAYFAMGWEIQADDLTRDITRIHRDGETPTLIQTLRDECPQDAEALGVKGNRTDREITLAEASNRHDVPKPEWTRATKRQPDHPDFLAHRRVGRHVLVIAEHAKAFAKNYEARREQRTVGSRSEIGAKVVSRLRDAKKVAIKHDATTRFKSKS